MISTGVFLGVTMPHPVARLVARSHAATAARAGIKGRTLHDLRGTAVVTLAGAGCNEVEIYSITGHKPGDVQAIPTAHYLPRDAAVTTNAIAKLNTYKHSRGDQNGGENLPTALPTALKFATSKPEKAQRNQLAGAPG